MQAATNTSGQSTNFNQAQFDSSLKKNITNGYPQHETGGSHIQFKVNSTSSEDQTRTLKSYAASENIQSEPVTKQSYSQSLDYRNNQSDPDLKSMSSNSTSGFVSSNFNVENKTENLGNTNNSFNPQTSNYFNSSSQHLPVNQIGNSTSLQSIQATKSNVTPSKSMENEFELKSSAYPPNQSTAIQPPPEMSHISQSASTKSTSIESPAYSISSKTTVTPSLSSQAPSISANLASSQLFPNSSNTISLSESNAGRPPTTSTVYPSQFQNSAAPSVSSIPHSTIGIPSIAKSAPLISNLSNSRLPSNSSSEESKTTSSNNTPLSNHRLNSNSTNVIPPSTREIFPNSTTGVSCVTNSGSAIPPYTSSGLSLLTSSGVPPLSTSGVFSLTNSEVQPLSTSGIPSDSRSGFPTLSTSGIPPFSSSGVPPLSNSGIPPLINNVVQAKSNSGVPLYSSSGVQSLSNNGIHPFSSSVVPPLSNSGISPLSNNVDQTRSNSGIPPYSSLGVQSLSNNGIHPFSSSGVPPLSNSGIFPLSNNVDQAQSNSGIPPYSSSGVQSLPNNGIPSYSSSGVQSMSNNGIHPFSSSGVPPLSNIGMPPFASNGVPPQSSRGIPPFSSTGVPPLSSSGIPPFSSSGIPPYSSTGVPPTSRSSIPPYMNSGIPPQPNFQSPNSGTPLSNTSMPLVPASSSTPPSLSNKSKPNIMKNRYPTVSTQDSNFVAPTMSSLPGGVSAPFPNPLTPPYTNNSYSQGQISDQRPLNSSYNNYQVPPPNTLQVKQPQYPGSNFTQQTHLTQSQPGLQSQFANMSIQQGLNRMWGYEAHDLLNSRNILPSTRVESPPIRLPQELADSSNCSPELFRCTLTKIPISKNLLEKSRLPLGVLIHPFKDINQLKVIKNVIVRCRSCRAYINPFVQFIDNKVWKCNLCFRANDIHEQFLYDRNTEMYGDPYRRPEVQSATVEYLASAEYNVRDPPQPAMYLFLLDVSQIASQSNYLSTVCEVLLNHLKQMPGDLRKSIGIITYDSAVHFYSLSEGQTQPTQLIITDIDDIFLPSPENIMVNVNECFDVIEDLLKQLPEKFKESYDSGSALGAALQAAYKLLKPTGGRITVFQTCLPNIGPGALTARENPNQRSNDDPPHMKPATDFYKKLALECMPCQIAIDLFILNSQFVDLGTLAGVSQFSSGCMHHIPLYSGRNMSNVYQLERMLTRYLVRKIGFESVMRIRCTQGLAIHSFHGNFFIRSPDLLALPNVNPDAGFGMQISINDTLTHIPYVCFQAAVLYTSSKGDRRIRVHTLCLPVVSNVNDVFVGADQQCIAGLLAKMAVDRSLQYSLTDAREAFLNVVCDILATYKATQSGHATGSLLAPSSLKLLPLYILALLKHPAFRVGQSTRLDDRLFAMCEMKCLPLSSLILSIYPELYPIHTLDQDPTFEWNELAVPAPQIVQLSAERLQASGTYLLNTSDSILILVRHGTSPQVCSGFFGFQQASQMPETMYELPQLETTLSVKLQSFIAYLNDEKAYYSPVKIIKDSSPDRMEFYDRLIEDKNAAGMSYYEFLQRIREMVK